MQAEYQSKVETETFGFKNVNSVELLCKATVTFLDLTDENRGTRSSTARLPKSLEEWTLFPEIQAKWSAENRWRSEQMKAGQANGIWTFYEEQGLQNAIERFLFSGWLVMTWIMDML